MTPEPKYPHITIHIGGKMPLTILGKVGARIFQEEGGRARNKFLNDVINNSNSYDHMIERIQEYVYIK